MKSRIQIEDALKHLYKEEQDQRAATIDSLAGALSEDRARIVEVLQELRQAHLLTWEDNRFVLSDTGRDYALQVIRAHRLYERYLADLTGVSEERWHSLAEDQEHALDAGDLDDMEAMLGYPRFDPHGDPIPTSSGDFHPLNARPLMGCPVGWHGAIVHIEDEPDAVYQGIISLGLAAGMHLEVLDRRGEALTLNAQGQEIILPYALAGNIGVEAQPEAVAREEGLARLSHLKPGQTARVVGLTAACRGAERNRLLDLGVVPGTRIDITLQSPSGNPTAYDIRGATIALRKDQAERIVIQKEDE